MEDMKTRIFKCFAAYNGGNATAGDGPHTCKTHGFKTARRPPSQAGTTPPPAARGTASAGAEEAPPDVATRHTARTPARPRATSRV